MQLLYIACSGAIGAVLRFWVSTATYAWLGRDFPYGTLVVNVLGSFLMGLLSVMILERGLLPPEWRAVLLVGFLGAFTTFSTFSIETLYLLEEGSYVKAGLNMVLSVVLCVLSAWLGLLVGRPS